MQTAVERHRVRGFFRVAYVFLGPAVVAYGLYLSTYLGLNSRQGAEAVASLASQAVAGRLDFAFASFGPDLLSADLFDARLEDLNGRPVIELRRMRCQFSPGGLVRRRILLNGCQAYDGRILVESQIEGGVGFLDALTGHFQPKRNPRPPPVFTMNDFSIHNVDVLISTEDLVIRFDDVELENGRLEGGRGFFEFDADAVASGGRFMASPRLFSFGDGKPTWGFVNWDIARANRPWSVAWTDAPKAPRGERGMLDVPLDEVVIDRFRMRDDNMEIGRLLLAGPEMTFDGEGLARLMPEQPKLAPSERAVLAYEGNATLSVPPDSVALRWALPGIFPREAGPESHLAPLVFSGFGTVRFFQGATRLRANDVEVAGRYIDRIDTGISWDNGLMQLTDDAVVELYGGTVTGAASFLSDDGTWQAGVCVQGLDVGALGRDLVDADAVNPMLAARLSTVPSVCTPGGSQGLLLHGDLTLKAFELAPALDTPLSSPIQGPMLVVQGYELGLTWDRSPPFMPWTALQMDVTAALTQRGVVEFAAARGPGLRVRARGDSLAFSGDIDIPNEAVRRGDLAVESTNVAAWLSMLGMPLDAPGVHAQASARLDGPLGNPRVSDLAVSADNAVGDPALPAFSADAVLGVDGNALLVDDLNVRSDAGSARVRGQVALFDGSPWAVRSAPDLDVVVVLNDVDVEALAPDLGIDAELDATFGLRGTPDDLELAGSHLEVVDFRAFGEPIDYLWIDRYRFSDRRIEAESVFLVKGKGNLRGDVAVDLNSGELSVSAAGRRFRLSEVRAATEAGVAVRGQTDFDVNVSGTIDAPQIGGRTTVRGLRAMGVDLGDVAATFYTFDGAIEVAAEVATDLDVAAVLPLDGSPWTVTGAFNNLPLVEHMPSLEGVFDRGRITGAVEAVLDPLGEGVYEATLQIDALDLRVEKRRFEMPQPAVATWSAITGPHGLEHHIEVQTLTLGTDGRFLNGVGTLEANAEGTRLFVDVQGDTDFSLLRFFPDLVVDADGLARVDVTIEGSLEEAAMVGSVTFDEARIAPRGLGTSVNLGPGRLTIGDGAISVSEAEPLSGTLYGGDFTAWGDIGLDGLNPTSVDYRLFVTNVAYRIPDVANVTLTSENLRFQAPDLRDYESWLLSGDVQLVDARYYEDIEVVGDSFSFGGFGRTVDRFSLPIWQTVPAIGSMSANLRIQGRDRFIVDNTIATAEMDMEFRTDLMLTGRIGAMVLVGEMEALSGSTVTYRGQTFDVQEAILSFRGGRDPRGFPMPVLDSELTASIRPCSRRDATSSFDVQDTSRTLDEAEDVFITALVRGQMPSDLSFQLQSTPFYDQRDQLSLILTGCTVDELTVGDAGGRTLEVVLAPVINVVERSVEERLDLDDVDLLPATDGTTGISIQDEVSERFTWRLDASVGTDGADDRQVVRGEYRIFDWLLLEIQEQTVRDEDISLDTGFRFRVRLD